MTGMTRQGPRPPEVFPSEQPDSIGSTLVLLFKQVLSKLDVVIDKLRIVTVQLADMTGSDVTEKDIGDVD